MTTETFGYNKKSAIQTMLICAGGIVYLMYNLVLHTQSAGDPYLWVMLAPVLVLFSYIVYLYVKRIKPAMRQETALELTPAELIFNPKNIAIPWKNISDINTRPSNRSGTQQHLDISLNEPAGEHISIELHWIAGDPVDVYNVVNNYLYDTRKAPGKSSAG